MHHHPLTRRRFLTAALAAGACSAAPPEGTRHPILAWNEALLRWVRAQTPPPALTARNLVLLHLAQWRALAARPRDPAAALHAAAREICDALFPAHSGEIAALLPRADTIADVANARRIAREVLASRAADGSSTTIHYLPKEEPGQWRRTPPAMRPPELPHWGKVTPFLLKTADQFRPPPPLGIASEAFASDLAEVRDLSGKDSTRRSARETETAHFWSDFSYTTSPPGHWNDIARQLAAARNLNLKETARLFALLNLALADAAIAIWDCKYHYNFWRPVTAIHARGEKDWQPLLTTPPHPDYVSGHSAFSGAAAAVLQSFFGTDKLSFTAASDTVKGTTRRYRSLQACAEEISHSRILGGIHFPSACREGLILGRKVGEWTVQTFRK